MLCLDGSLKRPLVFTATSGSTGEPFYFPRWSQLDWEAAVAHLLFLKQNFQKSKGPILVIDCFGMGIWIGGLITYKAFEILSRWGNYPISILTPGINKIEIFNALRRLGPSFEQVILAGYPPFLKDVVDEAIDQGIDLKKLNLRFLFAAEPFTEKFRDYVTKKAHVKSPYLDTLNIYGTADIGAMAYETPVSILVRRQALQSTKVFQEIFSHIKKTPTLAQYNPLFITFEALDGDILLTGNNAIPLVRYSVGDHGGVFSFSELADQLKNFNIDVERKAHQARIPIYELPFVYVYERNDFSTTLYGLQIYPETIREALLDHAVSRFFTGKFTILTKFNRRQNQYLEINLELRKKKEVSMKTQRLILKKIVSHLRANNSEYRELSSFLGERAEPHLVFWPAEHSLYFKPGVKQTWVQKSNTIVS